MYYKYHVLSNSGSEVKGSMGGTPESVKNSLKKDNYYIVSVRPDIFKWVIASLTRHKLKAQDLSLFFEDMANMLHIGIAINEVIISLRKTSAAPELTKSLSSIGSDLKSGFSLGAAFEKTGVFPGLVINMLKVGEKSGNLEKVLMDLSKHYSREADFVSGLKSALVYPFIVFSMLVGIMFYISFKVIPHLEELLPIRSGSYFATRMLLASSHFLKDFWYICILVPILSVIFIHSFFNKNSAKSAGYYSFPIIGEIARDIYFTTIFSNLALLQRNGINIIDSLALTEETTHHKFLAKKISKIKDFITSGMSLWQALEKDSFFPSFVYYSVRKGEEAGSLDLYLEGLSKYCFDKATRRIRAILGLIQPALLVFCACVLLFIILAFIMPVYSNLSNIAGGNVKF